MRISAVQSVWRPPSVAGAPDSSCHCRPTIWPGIGFACVAPVKAVNGMVIGDRALDISTVYPYSMHHKSELNARYVRDFKAQRDAKARPTIMSVAAYDGMAAIYADRKSVV